jgi:hypothetical protein
MLTLKSIQWVYITGGLKTHDNPLACLTVPVSIQIFPLEPLCSDCRVNTSPARAKPRNPLASSKQKRLTQLSTKRLSATNSIPDSQTLFNLLFC